MSSSNPNPRQQLFDYVLEKLREEHPQRRIDMLKALKSFSLDETEDHVLDTAIQRLEEGEQHFRTLRLS